jgi:hypothetical protein
MRVEVGAVKNTPAYYTKVRNDICKTFYHTDT